MQGPIGDARPGEGERLVAGRVGLALELEPDVREAARLVDVVARERLPGLGVDRRVVQDLRSSGGVLVVARVPLAQRREVPIDGSGARLEALRRSRCGRSSVQTPAMRAQSISMTEVVARRDRQEAVARPCRDRTARPDRRDRSGRRRCRSRALTAGQMRDREPVVGEPGEPPAPVEAGEVLHQIDLVAPRRVASRSIDQRKTRSAAMLIRLGPDEDAHHWARARHRSGRGANRMHSGADRVLAGRTDRDLERNRANDLPGPSMTGVMLISLPMKLSRSRERFRVRKDGNEVWPGSSRELALGEKAELRPRAACQRSKKALGLLVPS